MNLHTANYHQHQSFRWVGGATPPPEMSPIANSATRRASSLRSLQLERDQFNESQRLSVSLRPKEGGSLTRNYLVESRASPEVDDNAQRSLLRPDPTRPGASIQMTAFELYKHFKTPNTEAVFGVEPRCTIIFRVVGRWVFVTNDGKTASSSSALSFTPHDIEVDIFPKPVFHDLKLAQAWKERSMKLNRWISRSRVETLRGLSDVKLILSRLNDVTKLKPMREAMRFLRVSGMGRGSIVPMGSVMPWQIQFLDVAIDASERFTSKKFRKVVKASRNKCDFR